MSKRQSSEGYRKGSSSGSSSGSEDEDEKRIDESKKPKLSFGFGKMPQVSSSKQAPLKVKSIQIKLSGQTKVDKVPPVVKAPSQAVSAAFNVDDDDEVEEMPPEAKMRMRNIGRETPTSAGPNSFGKTKQGFCDAKKVFEKTLKKAMESSSDGVPGKNRTH